MVEEIQDTHRKLKRIYIESTLPKGLEGLNTLANNLWWSWNNDAIELFKSLDPENWERLHYNPIAILNTLSYERGNELLADKSFVAKLNKLEKAFKAYVDKKPATDVVGAPLVLSQFGHTLESVRPVALLQPQDRQR